MSKRMFVFAVRDSVAGYFNPPFVTRSLGEAERGFTDAVRDPKHPFNAHPEDYELFQLGTYDDGTGMFEVGVPVSVAHGKAVARARSVSDVSQVGPALS